MDGQSTKQEGLKEIIFQIFDSIIPAESGNKAFGINDFQEIGETFRQMVDLAVDEHDTTVSTYINGRIGEMSSAYGELNAKLIEKDAQLQESLRKEEAATDYYTNLREENTRLENDFSSISTENVSLKQRIIDLVDESTDKGLIITSLQEQLKAKDEQITKLTEEINKPKVNIELPSQAKPSVTLQQLMEAARNKPVKSAMEKALVGETFRGKVELSVPSLGGHEETESTFHGKTVEAYTSNSGVLNPEVPIVINDTPSQPEEVTIVGLDQYEPVSENNEEITWRAIEAIQERILRIEQQVGIVA